MSNQPNLSPNYQATKPEDIDTSVLYPVDYQYNTVRDIDISVQHPEFTAVCPMTGLPDFGTISIRYTPDKRIIELKSLKYYLMQYRNVGIFYEHVVNRILDDLVSVLAPKKMEVTGEFTPRGGITSKVTANYSPPR